jgi:hypothetical protein
LSAAPRRERIDRARFKDDDFSERRSTADKAKKAMVERFRARSSNDDPATAERKAPRLALSKARESRVMARKEAAKKCEEEEARSARDEVERKAAESRAEADRKVNLLLRRRRPVTRAMLLARRVGAEPTALPFNPWLLGERAARYRTVA